MQHRWEELQLGESILAARFVFGKFVARERDEPVGREAAPTAVRECAGQRPDGLSLAIQPSQPGHP